MKTTPETRSTPFWLRCEVLGKYRNMFQKPEGPPLIRPSTFDPKKVFIIVKSEENERTKYDRENQPITFHVSRHLLSRYSRFFAEQLDTIGLQAIDLTTELDTYCGTFQVFLVWILYRERICCGDQDPGPSDFEVDNQMHDFYMDEQSRWRLPALWLLVLKLESLPFQNFVMTAIFDHLEGSFDWQVLDLIQCFLDLPFDLKNSPPCNMLIDMAASWIESEKNWPEFVAAMNVEPDWVTQRPELLERLVQRTKLVRMTGSRIERDSTFCHRWHVHHSDAEIKFCGTYPRGDKPPTKAQLEAIDQANAVRRLFGNPTVQTLPFMP